MENDGTNSCVFLRLKIAHELLLNDCILSSKIAQLLEDIIERFPREINSCQDVSKRYDVLEAYEILNSNEILPRN